VPGTLITNRPIRRQNPALIDLAPTILKLYGLEIPEEMAGRDLYASPQHPPIAQ
jgi:bisphosphoglycerate-independent phosphoglycerate mutase (AlkP superfamily)